jgi:BASS family bile acid:Na+ symporter
MTMQQALVLALQASILMTVFGLGLRTAPNDVLYVVRRPGLLGRSLLAMFVIMPMIAVLLVRTLTLRPSVEIALVALALSPIPPLLPGKAEKAGGHGSYPLGLLVIAGLLSAVTVPATLALFGSYYTRPFAMSSAAIAGVVLKMIIAPLAAGMAFRALLPSVASRLAKPVGLVAKVLLGLGVLAILIAAMPSVLALTGGGTLLVVTAFVAAGLGVGHWLGGPDRDHRIVLALSTASRHPAIALAIAKENFPNEPYLGAAILLYLLVNAAIGIPYQARQRRLQTTAFAETPAVGPARRV